MFFSTLIYFIVPFSVVYDLYLALEDSLSLFFSTERPFTSTTFFQPDDPNNSTLAIIIE